MKTLPLFIAVLLALTGCAHGYILTLNNGERIKAADKPHLDRGFYYYKDTAGKPQVVFSGRVREVAPASMVSADKNGPKFLGP